MAWVRAGVALMCKRKPPAGRRQPAHAAPTSPKLKSRGGTEGDRTEGRAIVRGALLPLGWLVSVCHAATPPQHTT